MMVGKAILICTALLLASCGDGGGSADSRETPTPTGNHVWKSQTDMIEKSRGVEDMVMEQSAKQRQTIDDMAR
jgi:hypothetical protein